MQGERSTGAGFSQNSDSHLERSAAKTKRMSKDGVPLDCAKIAPLKVRTQVSSLHPPLGRG